MNIVEFCTVITAVCKIVETINNVVCSMKNAKNFN